MRIRNEYVVAILPPRGPASAVAQSDFSILEPQAKTKDFHGKHDL